MRCTGISRRAFLKAAGVALAGPAWSTITPAAEPAPRRPNILFCIADDASWVHMGAYGCSWVQTPGFDRVAREGVLSTNAYTPNAKCAPSRSCILTGRNSWQLEAAANHWCYFPVKFKTYAEVLSEQGYHVGFTGKGWAPGVARTADGQPRHLAGKPYQARKLTPPTRAISNKDYAANFADFLAARPEDKPFCFWYGGHEPHRAYEFDSGRKKGGKQLDQVNRVPGQWPDNETVRADLLDYAFEIEHFDKHLQAMLTRLEEQNLLDNTLVVVTADNGMPFPHVKGQEYEYSNHLPLAMMWKQGIRNPGRKVDDYVCFIDFAPTFLESAGVDGAQAGMAPITGRSLTEIFQSTKSGQCIARRDHVLIGKERHDVGRPNDLGYPIRGIVKDGFLYLHNFEPDRWPAGNPETGYLNTDGSPTKTECLEARRMPETRRYWTWSFGKRPTEELYDIRKDSDCLENLAERPELQARKAALKEQLFEELRAQGDPRMFGRGHIFDAYPYADGKTGHFYERYRSGELDKKAAGWVNPSDFDGSAP
ncbi:MAG: sulfatase [Phycisphaerales bacterium]|nr:MAG: sulfatase [Phycisphaerales bacterium]